MTALYFPNQGARRPTLQDSAETWMRSRGFRVPSRSSPAWGGLFTAWQRGGMQPNPAHTRTTLERWSHALGDLNVQVTQVPGVHGRIRVEVAPGAVLIVDKRPGPASVAEVRRDIEWARRGWLANEQWKASHPGGLQSNPLTGPETSGVLSGARYALQLAPQQQRIGMQGYWVGRAAEAAEMVHTHGEISPGREWEQANALIPEIDAQRRNLTFGHRVSHANPKLLKRDVTAAERDYANALFRYGPTNLATERAAIYWQEAKTAWAAQQAAKQPNPGDWTVSRLSPTNPAYGGMPPMAREVCKRCHGARQVQLGPRMVPCPLCCRNPVAPAASYSPAARGFLEQKIPALIAEGYPPAQARAIALDMARRARLKVPPRPNDGARVTAPLAPGAANPLDRYEAERALGNALGTIRRAEAQAQVMSGRAIAHRAGQGIGMARAVADFVDPSVERFSLVPSMHGVPRESLPRGIQAVIAEGHRVAFDVPAGPGRGNPRPGGLLEEYFRGGLAPRAPTEMMPNPFVLLLGNGGQPTVSRGNPPRGLAGVREVRAHYKKFQGHPVTRWTTIDIDDGKPELTERATSFLGVVTNSIYAVPLTGSNKRGRHRTPDIWDHEHETVSPLARALSGRGIPVPAGPIEVYDPLSHTTLKVLDPGTGPSDWWRH